MNSIESCLDSDGVDSCASQDPEDDADEQAPAATLPDLALLIVFEYVAAENLDDLVSAGQVCRHWRRVAASEDLWRARSLKCHAMATQAFTRIMAFAPRLRTLDVCWINQISPEDRVIRKNAVLESPCRLERLTGVMCHRDSEWTHRLLRRHAMHLRELEVGTANRAALEVVATMPRLRALQVSSGDAALDKDPFLFTTESLFSEKKGLEQLEIRGLPQETTVTLMQAHKHTLRKLTLNIGTPSTHPNAPGWPKTCNNLSQVLQCCGLHSLQNLILTRYVGCQHFFSECVQQRKSLKQYLPSAHVQCSDCSF